MFRMSTVKKLLGMAAIAICSFAFFSMGAEAATAKVTADSAYIRSEASTSASKVSGVQSGDTLDVISQETDSSGYTWYKVYVDANTTGFIRADLVTVDGSVAKSVTSTDTATSTATSTSTVSTEVTVPNETEPMTATVTDTVNVRAGASTSHAIAASAKKSTAVTVTGYAVGADGKTWYQVTYTDGTETVNGYIREDFVKLDGELIDKVEETEATEEDTEAEAEAEEEETVYKDYEAVYEADEDAWYLYNYIEGSKIKIDDLYEAKDLYATESEELEAAKTSRTIWIGVLLAIILILIGAGIYAYINFRRWYYGYGETEKPVETAPEVKKEKEPEVKQIKTKPVKDKEKDERVVRPTTSNIKAQTIGAPEKKSNLPEGAVKLPDGRVQMPDGSIRRVVTGVRQADGSVKLSDGRVQMPDGSIKYPDGSVKTADGHIIKPEVTLSQAQPQAASQVRTGTSTVETREIPRKTVRLTQDDDDMEFGFLNLDDINEDDK